MKLSITLSEAQQEVDQWINHYGQGYFDVLTNMTLLSEEVGELARVIARSYGMQKPKPEESPLNLAEEIGDILWVLCCLANQTEVDLSEAFRATLEKKTARDAQRYCPIKNKSRK